MEIYKDFVTNSGNIEFDSLASDSTDLFEDFTNCDITENLDIIPINNSDSNIENTQKPLAKSQITNISAEKDDEGIYFAIGTQYDDIINGSKYSDLITGNQGNDIIYGGNGADTYIFNTGDGVDEIKDASKDDCIHINARLDDLKYTRVNNDLQISYTAEDKIILTDFFKNKSSKNIDLIKNLEGEDQIEYEKYINNPNYRETYYLNQPHRIYTIKTFWSESGYELCEKSILKDAVISVDNKSNYTGTNYNECVTVLAGNSKFNLGTGNDTLVYSKDFGKSTVTLNKKENLNIKINKDTDTELKTTTTESVNTRGIIYYPLESKNNVLVYKEIIDEDIDKNIDFSCKISGKNLVLTFTNNNVITLKNYLSLYKDIDLNINYRNITSYESYQNMLKVDVNKFNKGNFTGTVLNDDIDASRYVSSNKKTGVTINSKSGNDKVVGSAYNDVIKVKSLSDEKTEIYEYGGNNKITAGAGGDSIIVSGNSSNTIKTGSGYNTVKLLSSGVNKVTCGKNNDSVTIESGTNNVNLKAGFNSATILGGNNKIKGGKNQDSINVAGGINTINTGAGDDIINISSGISKVNGGKGNDIYKFSAFDFEGHVDIKDSKGDNRLQFSNLMLMQNNDELIGDIDPQLRGKTNVFFDVTVNNKGKTIVGTDFLFTTSNNFSSFNDSGIHVIGKNTISHVDTLAYCAIAYGSYTTEYTYMVNMGSNYDRPNFREGVMNTYSVRYDELAQKVAGWLTSDANTSGYKSAMEIFTKGTEEQIAELTKIYVSNRSDVYQLIN